MYFRSFGTSSKILEGKRLGCHELLHPQMIYYSIKLCGYLDATNNITLSNIRVYTEDSSFFTFVTGARTRVQHTNKRLYTMADKLMSGTRMMMTMNCSIEPIS